jgi:hypothetical protein
VVGTRQLRLARAGSIWLLLVLSAFSTVWAAGDEPRPRVTIQRLDRAPEIGEFLDMEPPEDLARQMLRIEGLTQRVPEDGEPASQKTHIYLGYDDQNLYVVFVAFDSEPHLIRANMSRRERVFTDDTVEIMLDTFNDERRAFAFLTNPFGIQWDAIWTEGQGFDSAWDQVWQSRGQLTDEGYVVWMAIPFKSLRFSPADQQSWGLIFVRDVPRNNETSFWPRVSSRIDGRLNQAATMDGLRDISPGRNMQIIPQATARRSRTLDAAEDQFTTENFDFDAGLDAKLVFRDRVTLDLTVNPDFSQVESDQPQVTVNQRFEVFFPERRPFFIEHADFFRTPFNLLFTRRIDEPRLGARMTGKVGRYALGALLIDDETPGAEAALDNPQHGDVAANGVVRINRDVSERSTVGVMYTGRTFGDRRNQVGAADGRIVLSQNWDTELQAAFSSTSGSSDGNPTRATFSDPAWQFVVNRRGRKTNWHLHYLDIGDEFETDLGFVPRTGIRDAHQQLSYDFRPEGPRLVSFGPTVFTTYSTDQNGTRLDEGLRFQFDFEFRRQTDFGFFTYQGRERLPTADLPEPQLAPDGLDFDASHYGFFFNTRFIESVQGNLSFTIGDGINLSPPAGENPIPGEEVTLGLDLTLRLGRQLRIDNRYLLTRLDDDATGARVFLNQIFRTTWNYQFTKRLTLRAIIDFRSTRADDELTTLETRRNVNGDLLLAYLVNPWTAIYAGYNSNHATDDALRGTSEGASGELVNDSRELFVKASYLYRF